MAINRVALVRAEGDQLAAAFGVFDHALRVLRVGVDAAETAGIKNLQLGCKIIVKIGVFDGTDMVAADVEPCAHVKRDAAHAPVLERLGRRLHDKVRDPRIHSVLKMPVKLQHLRPRNVRFLAHHTVVVVNGGEDGARRLVLRSKPVVEDIADIVSGRAFALGAGDGDRGNGLRYLIIKKLTEHDERIADVADKNVRRIHLVAVVGNIGDSAAGERRVKILLLEMCALTDEKRVGTESARVVSQACDRLPCECAFNVVGSQNAGVAQRVDVFLQSVSDLHRRLLLHLNYNKYYENSIPPGMGKDKQKRRRLHLQALFLRAKTVLTVTGRIL